jgi:heptosyltransferase-2
MPLPHATLPSSSAPHPKVLTVRLCNWIGDVVMALPALELLAAHGFELQLYGKGWARTLLSGYDWAFTKRSETTLGDRLRELRALRQQGMPGRKAARQRIDALSFPNSLSAALELRLSGHRVRGYAKDGRSFLLSARHERLQNKHVLETFWYLACQTIGQDLPPPAQIGFRISPAAMAKADALLAEQGLQDQAFACVVPFATGMMFTFEKKWPHFADFIAQLSQHLPVLICPGPGEETEAQAHAAHARILPGVPLDVYAALMARARLNVANDTGPGHLAAAVGAPLISVLGPTDPEHWAPWGPNVTVARAWPQWPSADSVLQTAQALLKG